MVLVSPQLGRSNNHPPLCRYAICSSSSTPTDPTFLASPHVPSNGHASTIYFSNQKTHNNNNFIDTFKEPATIVQAQQTPYLKTTQNMDNCWTNLFSGNSNSTPVLNTREHSQNGQYQTGQCANITNIRNSKRLINGTCHHLVSPSFSSGDCSDSQPALLGSYPVAKITHNQLAQTNSSPDSSAVISAQQQLQNQQNQQQMTNSKLYKTELCRSWVDTGRCNYGERCQYAHGDNEKRPIPRHPKYKTEACQSYHKTGYCPYGPRCHFIHNEEPSVLAGLVASGGSSNSTASGGTTPTNGSNPNILLQRQLNSSMGSGSSSASSASTTPQHMPLNMRMPPPSAIPAAYFQQHQPLSMTHSWCVGGPMRIQQQNNASNLTRASNPLVDSSMFNPKSGMQQFYTGLQQQQQKQPSNVMRIPISSTFSQPIHQQALNPSICYHPNATQTPIPTTAEANRTTSSLDGGDSSPTSSLPSSADSGTESPSLGSGSFSPALEVNSHTRDSVFCRLSPTSFRSSLIILNKEDSNRRNSEGGSTVLADLEPSSASPNSSLSFGSTFSTPEATKHGQKVTAVNPQSLCLLVEDQENLANLSKNLVSSMSLGGNDQESEAESLRRTSESSIGSIGLGNTQISSTNSCANMTNNSSATSSDAEIWSITGAVGNKQALGRLPVFERLSNGPF